MRWKLALGVAATGLAVWASVDLWAPLHSDPRRFDAGEVARLETGMWRDYYDQKRVALFLEMSQLMRRQFGFPWLRSQVAAYHAARAAFEFKKGKNRGEYEAALPDLRSFYASIRRVSTVPFDAERAARLELEWWIVHRQRDQYGREALIRSLAELQGCLYQLPVESFLEHATARADAMLLRDRDAEQGGVPEQDWARIHELLERSWASLYRVVNGRG